MIKVCYKLYRGNGTSMIDHLISIKTIKTIEDDIYSLIGDVTDNSFPESSSFYKIRSRFLKT